jgi:hypothetical protein
LTSVFINPQIVFHGWILSATLVGMFNGTAIGVFFGTNSMKNKRPVSSLRRAHDERVTNILFEELLREARRKRLKRRVLTTMAILAIITGLTRLI